jgi:uncharacterized protein YjdB
MKSRIIALAAFAAFMFSSCVQTPAEVSVTGVSLSEDDIELTEGQTHTLVATVLPENATNKAVEWKSAVPDVATVTGDGIVEAIAMGATTITATTQDGGFKASCRVIVKKKLIHVQSVSLNLPSITLTEGGSVILGATISPANADDRSVSWSASPESVVTVEQDGHNGIVTAVGPGEGTVTVTTSDGGFQASCKVTVEAATIDVESVTLDKETLDLKEGETATLTATVLPEDATDKTVSWKSTNPDVATVDGEGNVTAILAGQASITASSGGKEASCQVTVSKIVVDGVTVNPATLELVEGDVFQLSASVSPAEADQTVEWASMDASVAKVDYNNGTVTAVSAGTTRIFARSKAFPDQQGSCEITVTPDPSLKGIELSSAIMTMQVGESRTLTVNYTPSYAANKNVSWASSNPSVAAVDKDGTVTAFAEGSATVTATSEEGGFTASCEVTVSGSAGPMIFHCNNEGGNSYGYINLTPDPRNGIEYDGYSSNNAYIPVAEFYEGSLYTVEKWTQWNEVPYFWLCKDRKPIVKLPFDHRTGGIKGLAVRDNWFAILQSNGNENIKLFRGDFSGSIDEIVLDSSTTSAINIYDCDMAAFPDGSIQIVAHIKDPYWTEYLAVYTIPYNKADPQENLIEINSNPEPRIAVDPSTADAYILSNKEHGGARDVNLYKKGADDKYVLVGKVDEVDQNYGGALACRDGHYYYAVYDYNKQETRVYKDGALQYTIQDRRQIYYDDVAPLRVSSSGDIYLVLRWDDTALYKNGSLFYSDSWNGAFNPYCIIE